MLSFKKLCTYYQIATIFLFCTFSIYAIFRGDYNQLRQFPALISKATAQEQPIQTFNSAKIDRLKQASSGFFTNLNFANKSYNTGDLSFNDKNGKNISLKEFNGKIVLVNFWAIWCPPCRQEMPELANLKQQLASDDFDVLTINVDTVADDAKLYSFLKDIKAENLPLYRDKTMEILKPLRRDGLAMGLPVTLLIDENGLLLASYNGSAPWGNDDAIKLIKEAINLKNGAM